MTQEVFLALIGETCGYDPQRGTVAGYLFGVARKLVLRHLERNQSVLEHDIEDREWMFPEIAAGVDPVSDLMRQEGIEALRRAIVARHGRRRLGKG